MRHALVIANSAYSGACRIETPKKNGEAMGSALKSIGFQTVNTFDVDEDAMRTQIKNFVTPLQKGDIVFFYYSGFAIQAEDSWLLPVSYQNNQLDEIGVHAYGLKRLLEQLLEEKQGLSAVVVLDASRVCPAWADTEVGLNAPTLRNAGILLAFSAPGGHTVADPRDGSVNLFTSELIGNLKTRGLKPIEVFDRTQGAVRKATENREIPWFESLAVGDFYLTGPPAVTPPRAPDLKLRPGQLRTNHQDLLRYAWIPAGSFQMGCVPQDKKCAQDERPQHSVNITKSFWMTTTEVTVETYERFANATNHKKPQATQTNTKEMLANLPETKVSWDDAEDFCKWAGAEGGRLPTEAEWEYAARGGKDGTIYPWGDTFDPERVNSFEKSRKKRKYHETTPVSNYNDPNGFSLFDMIGNVREWTLDVYDPDAYSRTGPFQDPLMKQGNKSERVLRGGDFDERRDDLRISARDHRPIDKGDNRTGFRCIAPDIL